MAKFSITIDEDVPEIKAICTMVNIVGQGRDAGTGRYISWEDPNSGIAIDCNQLKGVDIFHVKKK